MKFILVIIVVIVNVITGYAQKTKTDTKPLTTVISKKPVTKATPKTIVKKTTVAKTNESIQYTYKATQADSNYVKNVAIEMCKCMAPLTDSLHPIIISLYEDIVTLGDKKAEFNFKKATEKLSITAQDSIIQGIKNFESQKNNIEKCATTIENKYKNINFNGIAAKEDVYDYLFIYYLKQQCRFAGLLLEVGKKNN